MSTPSLQHYDILTLGDGNMSFSFDLYKKLRLAQRSPVLSNYTFDLTASSFDSHQELISKYPEVAQFLQIYHNIDTNTTNCLAPLTAPKHIARYFGDVNACDIKRTISYQYQKGLDHNITSDTAENKNYDLIYFNNPHIGIEDLYRHIALLSHFFVSTHNVLSHRGQIVVTLCDDQPKRWELLQSAFRNKYICVAAVEMTSINNTISVLADTALAQSNQSGSAHISNNNNNNIIEWPFFQNKRHQNNTAFPYFKMVQYYFIPITQIIRNEGECFNSFEALHNTIVDKYNNTAAKSSDNIYLKSDLSIWLPLANQIIQTYRNNTATACHDAMYHIDWEDVPDHNSLTGHNVANWKSNHTTFTPLFPLISPLFAFYLPTSQYLEKIDNMPFVEGTDYINAIDMTFNPYLISLDQITRGYSLQYDTLCNTNSLTHLDINTYYERQFLPYTQKTLSKKKMQPSKLLSQIPKTTTLSTIAPEITSKLSPEAELYVKHHINPIIMPLPPNLDSKRLGRPLTQRELIKLERFLQREAISSAKPSTDADPRSKRAPKQSRKNNLTQTLISNSPQEQNIVNKDISALNLTEVIEKKNIPQQDNIHVVLENTSLICVLCQTPKEFPSSDAYKQHVLIKHSQKCNSALLKPNLDHQIDIIKLSTLVKDGKYSQGLESYMLCEICDLYYPFICIQGDEERNPFEEHWEFLQPVKGSEEKLLKCNHCELQFRHARSLAQHVATKHTEIPNNSQ